MKKNHSFIALCFKYALNLKLPLVMRISLTLLFAVVLQLSAANGYAQRIRGVISMNNVSIEQVLNKIEESSDYVFLYNDKAIQKNRIVSVNNNSGKIQDILDEIFRGTSISYTVVDKQIILSAKPFVQKTMEDATIPVKGIVKDVNGEPLIGVNVKVKGSNIGTITDMDGNTVSWASAGTIGYKGSKKKTPFAAGMAAEAAAKAAYDAGMRKVEAYVNGVGPARDTALRSLQTGGLEVMAMSDVTPIPHNGCRPPKRPRG